MRKKPSGAFSAEDVADTLCAFVDCALYVALRLILVRALVARLAALIAVLIAAA